MLHLIKRKQNDFLRWFQSPYPLVQNWESPPNPATIADLACFLKLGQGEV